MGVVGWFKQKFNIGGLKIAIVDVQPIKEPEGWVTGQVAYSSGRDVFGEVTYKLICETTTGKGDEKKVSTTTLGEMSVLIGVVLEAGEEKTEDFTFPYDLRNWFEQKGGVLGTAAKAFSFAKGLTSEKGYDEYYVQITAKIKGVWSDPTAKHPITVAVAR